MIGADNLLYPRSGVGRMTVEIAQAVQAHPGVANVSLLVRGRIEPFGPAALDELDRLANGSAGATLQATPLRQRLSPVLDRLPGLQRARRLRDAWRERSSRLDLPPGARGRLVYHEPNMIPAPFDAPTIVTVNDLSWHRHPEMHPAERVRWIERNLPRALARAARFVAISAFTAGELVSRLGVAPGLVDVVPLAAGAQFRPMDEGEAAATLRRYGLRDRGYVFSVSTLEPRKNFDRLLAAHRVLPPALQQRFPLAIAGGGGWGTVLDGDAARGAVASGRLLLLGRVPDSDLPALYARAAVVAYVSLYEGFGLPVLEAMAAGTPVVASSTTAVGEVARDAAFSVDPLDEAAIAGALRQVLEDEAVAEDLRASGLARAAEYSWARTADLLVASWRRVV